MNKKDIEFKTLQEQLYIELCEAFTNNQLFGLMDKIDITMLSNTLTQSIFEVMKDQLKDKDPRELQMQIKRLSNTFIKESVYKILNELLNTEIKFDVKPNY